MQGSTGMACLTLVCGATGVMDARRDMKEKSRQSIRAEQKKQVSACVYQLLHGLSSVWCNPASQSVLVYCYVTMLA